MGSPRVLGRRVLLGWASLGAASTALLAACGGAPASPTAAPKPAEATKPAPAATAAPAAAPATTAAKPAEATKPAAAAATTAPAVASTASASKPATAVTGSLTLSFRSGDTEYFDGRIKAFAAEQPALKVELQPIAGANAEYYPKLTSAFAAASAPDVFWVSTGFGLHHKYVHDGQLMVLDDYMKRDQVDASQWVKGAVETVKAVDQKFHALPWGMHPHPIGLYYNADLFKEMGVAPIDNDKETYESLTEKAVKLTKRSGNRVETWGLATTVQPFGGLLGFVRSFGGDFMKGPENKEPIMDSPGSVAALQWLYDIRATHKANPRLSEMDPANIATTFIAGRLAIMQGSLAQMSQVEKIAGKFTMGVGLIPKGPTGVRGSQAHVDTISGWSKGKQLDQSWPLIRFLTNKESGVQLALLQAFFGPRLDVWEDPRPIQKWTAPYVETWKNATLNCMPNHTPGNLRTTDLDAAMNNTLSPLWNTETTPKEIVPTLQTAMKAVLDKPI